MRWIESREFGIVFLLDGADQFAGLTRELYDDVNADGSCHDTMGMGMGMEEARDSQETVLLPRPTA